MGTRADFYEGRGAEAEWLGSIAWDGYPDGIDESILNATDAEIYRKAVLSFLKREDATLPEMGWPWPWETSHTTDFAYALDEGKVWASGFGRPWVPAAEWGDDADEAEGETPVFPNMKDRQNFTMGKRSGIMLIGPQGIVEGED